MAFHPTSLTQDVDEEILGLARRLYSAVPLPKLVDQFGGVDWLLAITKLVLEKMSLNHKLDLILRGNNDLMQLCDRLASMWLKNTTGEEQRVLEEALIRAKLLYKSDLHKA